MLCDLCLCYAIIIIRCRFSKKAEGRPICGARLHLENGMLSTVGVDHNHDPETAEILRMETVGQMKAKLSENPTRPAKQVFDEVTM